MGERPYAMSEARPPLVIIVSAPSGSGKTTIVKKLLERAVGIKRSVSYTTRSPRTGEELAKDYVFVPVDTFKKMSARGEFLEWEENFGNYYGTPRKEFEEVMKRGEDVILSIDVKGARRVKKEYPESVSVFIMPPSSEELVERLKKRNTDRAKDVLVRLSVSKEEIAAADEYDYLIVNEDLERAVEELRAVIEIERSKKKSTKGKKNDGKNTA